MPILRLVAEGVGPFEKLDLDLSDGKGNPHLGPHILAGVNGSGKTTVLKTIAWVLDRPFAGFDYEEWSQSLEGYHQSVAAVLLKRPNGRPDVLASGVVADRDELRSWLDTLQSVGLGAFDWSRLTVDRGLDSSMDTPARGGHKSPPMLWSRRRARWLRAFVDDAPRTTFTMAAYAPSTALRYIPNLDLTKQWSDPFEQSLAFGRTVQNEAIQNWLVGLYSKQAIARQRGQPSEEYSRSLELFGKALQLTCPDQVQFEVEIKPTLHPRLRVAGRSLNFSQLADGVRSTVAWLSDFMMRQECAQWDPSLKGKRPGILLLDEVDAHLHPKWQRTLLPALRDALPDVQIIVTSHSPFVISSCRGSKVHVFGTDESGRASWRRSCDAPVGESVMTTLDGIFGIESRFDVETERDLDEWNELKRMEAVGRLDSKGAARLLKLSKELSRRSEELNSIVGGPVRFPPGRKPSAGHSGRAKPSATKARTR